MRTVSGKGIIHAHSRWRVMGNIAPLSRTSGCVYSVGVNTTGARPISLISPIIRIISWGTQRSIAGAPSSRLIVSFAKKEWLKSIRTHARMSRASLGALPDGGFFANERELAGHLV